MKASRALTWALVLILMLAGAEGVQMERAMDSVAAIRTSLDGKARVKEARNKISNLLRNARTNSAAQVEADDKMWPWSTSTAPAARTHILEAADAEAGALVVSSEMFVSQDNSGIVALKEGTWKKATVQAFVVKKASQYSMYLKFNWIDDKPQSWKNTFAIGTHAMVAMKALEKGSHQRVVVVRQTEGAVVRMMASNPPFTQACCCKPAVHNTCEDGAVLHAEDAHCCKALSSCSWGIIPYRRGFYMKEATVRKCVAEDARASLTWTVHDTKSSDADLSKTFTQESPGEQAQLTATALAEKWLVALESRRAMLLGDECFPKGTCLTACSSPAESTCVAPELCLYEPAASGLVGGSCTPVKDDEMNLGGLLALQTRIGEVVKKIEDGGNFLTPCMYSCSDDWKSIGQDMMAIDQMIANSKTQKWATSMPKTFAKLKEIDDAKYTRSVRARLLTQLDKKSARTMLSMMGHCELDSSLSMATVYEDISSGDPLRMAKARRDTQKCPLIKNFARNGDVKASATRSSEDELAVESYEEVGDHDERSSVLNSFEDQIISLQEEQLLKESSPTPTSSLLEVSAEQASSAAASLSELSDEEVSSGKEAVAHFMTAMGEHAALMAKGGMTHQQLVAAAFAQVVTSSQFVARKGAASGLVAEPASVAVLIVAIIACIFLFFFFAAICSGNEGACALGIAIGSMM